MWVAGVKLAQIAPQTQRKRPVRRPQVKLGASNKDGDASELLLDQTGQDAPGKEMLKLVGVISPRGKRQLANAAEVERA